MDSQPTGAPAAPDLQGLRIDVLRAATEIYMAHAYPDGNLPPSVKNRLGWVSAPDSNAAELLSMPPFEGAGKNQSNGTMIYARRLGNARYPHMKLQIQPWPNPAGFLLSVNTHDQVLAIDPNAAGMSEFRAIQTENQRYKETIEQSWDDAGLPTFLRYLRSYIEQRGGGGEEPATRPGR